MGTGHASSPWGVDPLTDRDSACVSEPTVNDAVAIGQPIETPARPNLEIDSAR